MFSGENSFEGIKGFIEDGTREDIALGQTIEAGDTDMGVVSYNK